MLMYKKSAKRKAALSFVKMEKRTGTSEDVTQVHRDEVKPW